jgi:hypothetical protein
VLFSFSQPWSSKSLAAQAVSSPALYSHPALLKLPSQRLRSCSAVNTKRSFDLVLSVVSFAVCGVIAIVRASQNAAMKITRKDFAALSIEKFHRKSN